MTPNITRRVFANHMMSLASMTLLPSFGIRQRTLPTREIPRTGEQLPIVGLGSSKAVLQIPERGTDAIATVLRAFVELGGRVADTSPRPEAVDREFGRVLQDPTLRESLFLAVKINADGAQAGVDQFRQSQRLFGRRTFDLVQVESLRDLDAHWPNLLEWKETGQARYIGVTVSTYDRYEQLESFMRRAPLDFVHVNYSVMETRAEERILPLAADRGMAVLTNRPFMNGGYFSRVANQPLPDWTRDFECVSWAQFTLKYILANPTVTVALTETTNPTHMEENLNAAIGPLPDEATTRRMRDLVRDF